VKIALVVLAVVATVVVLIFIVGWSLPVRHRASRQATYLALPDIVYAAISSPERFPQWRSKVKSVEHVPVAGGLQSYREVGNDGSILYVVDDAVPLQRLVTRIADPSLPFGGRWTFELTPSGAGTVLRITEDGEVYNPVFRFMSKVVFGHNATIDGYLRDLARKLGHTVTIGG